MGVGVDVSRTREPGFFVLLAGMVDDDDGGVGRRSMLEYKILRISEVENKDILSACVEIRLLGKNGLTYFKMEKIDASKGM